MVMQDGLYGYVNPEGEYVIEPQYPLARTFSDGLACINKGGNRDMALGAGAMGGTYYFINSKNKIQFNDFSSENPMSFYNNVAVVTDADQNKSLLNKNGDIVASGFTVLGDCEENMIPAVREKEKKLGFIDPAGKWKIELPYKYFIGPYSDNLSAFTDTDTKLSGFFDTAGKIAIRAKYKSASNFKEGLARVKTDATYFFIDKNNKKAFEREFEFAGDFSEGFCAVQQMGQWGFINKKGELKIDFANYQGVREFSQGLAAVKTAAGTVGYIDTSGEMVIPAIFENGLSFKNGFAIIGQNGKMGFINKDGKIIIEPKYTRVGNFVDPNESNLVFKEN